MSNTECNERAQLILGSGNNWLRFSLDDRLWPSVKPPDTTLAERAPAVPRSHDRQRTESAGGRARPTLLSGLSYCPCAA